MSISEPFIRRPIATTLLTIAIALAGAVAFRLLPVSPLPQVDFPTISVNAGLPGASPETMASAVATPLERQFSRIASVSEMTSSSSLGSSNITLQFDLNRSIDAAARDVQAAINAARGYLPSNLPNNPNYRKVNPADAPIFMLALTSDVLSKSQMYDAASSILAQKLAQVSGVGQVFVGGGALPGVRIELNPTKLNKYGIGLEQVRGVLSGANANIPKGHLSDGLRMWEVGANDQLFKAIDYEPLIVAYRNGSAVRISDIGSARDAPEDIRNAGYANAKPSVLLIIRRQPNANIIETVDRIRAELPQLKAAIPQAIDMRVAMDQTVTIRASVRNVEETLIISVLLVILVVFAFLRNPRSTFIPSVAVPVSLIGTFGVMYLLGYSINNLSLMALTISTGFVVDDAIVVIENITRYLEQGMRPLHAALKGAQEIGFTVLSISTSLVAVFIPLLLMGGIVGRLFREFAVTLTVAIVVSMVVSLTATPAMCAHLLKEQESHGRLYRASERAFNWVVGAYGRTLAAVLRYPAITLAVLLATIALNVYLYIYVPKGFFPQQDNGRMMGTIQADQDTSFQAMDKILLQMIKIIVTDRGIDTVNGFTGGGGPGGGGLNTAQMFISLKPREQRQASADQIIARLRPKLALVPGATLYMQAMQDVRVGGRFGAAQYQYTMRGDNLKDLANFAPRILQQLRMVPIIADVNSDQQDRGLQAYVQYDRQTAARFGISPQLIDNTLYDAFGQRQVSTMYTSLNQYHVVMEAAPDFWQDPLFLRQIYVRSPSGQQVPLNAFTHDAPITAPLSVSHQGLFPAVTVSFNLQPGVALGDAVDAINAVATRTGLPPTMAGVGALLALLLTRTELTVIAIIGIILLIGIVKKNAILMIDFALAAERQEGTNSRDSIYEACMLRFRPIMMTTMAAMLGALPLALRGGTGSELRRPLGIAIIGGLMVSQLLTLYTTPVVYLYFDRLQHWRERARARRHSRGETLGSEA